MLGRLLSLTLLISLAFSLPAQAQEPTPTTLILTTARSYADTETPLTVALLADDESTSPVVGADVTVERRVGGEWGPVADVVTDENGRATTTATLSRRPRDNVFRASYDGDEAGSYASSRSGRVRAPIRRRTGVVRVGGPDHVVDEQRVRVWIRWRTRTGIGVPGRVKLFRRNGGGDWKLFRRPRTDRDGRASITVRPRTDTRWKARAPRLTWVTGDRSNVHRVDNLPPGVPVSLPRRAPRPRVDVPDQPHARGDGAHARVTRIPNRVWRQMTGRSWHRGCPVGRAGLRLLRINYWGFDGYRYRGELVARADAIDNMRAALRAMYARKLPIRSMYRVDRFGWSRRVHGANDYRSMAAGNTSAFNCRDVVGRPGVRSPHAYGRALDLNTWENPYHSADGWVPNSWWVGHSHPRVAWRSGRHAVVRIMRSHGFRWTYGTEDSQHFDVPAPSGRVVTVRRACPGVCD